VMADRAAVVFAAARIRLRIENIFRRPRTSKNPDDTV
jgi:hypothetical protein